MREHCSTIFGPDLFFPNNYSLLQQYHVTVYFCRARCHTVHNAEFASRLKNININVVEFINKVEYLPVLFVQREMHAMELLDGLESSSMRPL